MKEYIKPTISIVKCNINQIIMGSQQCSCLTHDLFGGCNGCHGGCGCNTWDPDLEEIIPGC